MQNKVIHNQPFGLGKTFDLQPHLFGVMIELKMSAICLCQHCNTRLEFETKDAGQWVPCPNCGMETTLYIPTGVLKNPPESLAVQKAAEIATIIEPVKYKLDIRLISGLELCVRAIRLYEANQVAALNSKKMEAAKLMGGVSTGLIPIGSLEYAVEAGLAIGIIEGLLSSGAASAGVKVLAEAVKMEDGIRASGKFFAIEEIVRIEQPIPNQWRKPYSRQIQVESPGFVGMKTESRTEHSAYIHIGDEFVCLSAEDQSVRCIRWSAVEQFVFNAKA